MPSKTTVRSEPEARSDGGNGGGAGEVWTRLPVVELEVNGCSRSNVGAFAFV